MRSRYAAILLSIAGLAFAAYDYVWLQGLGFPDGHLTELDRARIPLHTVVIGLTVLVGLYSLSLAFLASADRCRRGGRAVIVLYLAIGLAALLIDWHLGSYLDAGTGG